MKIWWWGWLQKPSQCPPSFPLIVRTGTNSGGAIKQISGFFLPAFFGQSFAFQASLCFTCFRCDSISSTYPCITLWPTDLKSVGHSDIENLLKNCFESGQILIYIFFWGKYQWNSVRGANSSRVIKQICRPAVLGNYCICQGNVERKIQKYRNTKTISGGRWGYRTKKMWRNKCCSAGRRARFG